MPATHQPSASTSGSNRIKTFIASTIGLAVTAGATAAALGVALFFVFARLTTGRWCTYELAGQSVIESSIRSAVAAVTVLGVAIAGALAFRRQLLTEQQHSHQIAQDARLEKRDLRDNALAVDRTLRERFASACTQLGDPTSATIRIAGVHTLAAVADDWLAREKPDEAQVCVDILCSYFRPPSPAPGTIMAEADDESTPSRQPADLAVDVPTRQAIAATISRRTAARKDSPVGPWSHMRFDFTGASFSHETVFEQVVLDGGQFDFTSAHIAEEGALRFARSLLSDGTLVFKRAVVDGLIGFESVDIDCQVDMQRLQVSAAGYANIEFTGCTVLPAGVIDFENSRLGISERSTSITFDKTTMAGGTVTFQRARAGYVAITFNDCHFHSGTLCFDALRGGHKQDPQAHFAGSTLTGGRITALPVRMTFMERHADVFDEMPRGMRSRERMMRRGPGPDEGQLVEADFQHGGMRFEQTRFEGTALQVGRETVGNFSFYACHFKRNAPRPEGPWPTKGKLSGPYSAQKDNN